MDDELVGIVAHELRTPLAAILGYVEELRSGDPGPLTQEQAQFLEIVDRNAARLLGLVDDVVFLEQPSLQVAAVDLSRAAGLEDGDVTVEGDAARLEQLVQSLVSVTEADAVRVESRDGEAVVEVDGTVEPASTARARFQLALARAIATAHNGVVERDGTTFRVHIPFAQEAA
jgi:signal transduction histidine kinase